jgi:hypothetical protein
MGTSGDKCIQQKPLRKGAGGRGARSSPNILVLFGDYFGIHSFKRIYKILS